MKTKWFNFSFSWLSRKKIKNYSKIVFVDSRRKIPDIIDNKIYLVGYEGFLKWAIFNCPCNQKNRVEVNLMKSKNPYWESTYFGKKISLYPSIAIDEKCYCHFWLKNNKAYVYEEDHLTGVNRSRI